MVYNFLYFSSYFILFFLYFFSSYLTEIILIIDSQINRKMLQRILFNKNIQSDTSENGQDAVHMYAKNPNKYSVIFMDNMMPEMVFLYFYDFLFYFVFLYFYRMV